MFIAILKYKPPFSFSLVPQLTITNADALVDEFFSMNSLKKYTWTVFFVLLWCTYYRLIRDKQKTYHVKCNHNLCAIEIQ